MTLQIKFTNDITLKYIHDLIMDYEPDDIELVELEDITNLENIFTICNLLQYYGNVKIKYTSYRNELPIDEISPDLFFRGVPFDVIELNGKLFNHELL